MSVLHKACYYGDIVKVSALLSEGNDGVIALLQSKGLVFAPYPPQVVSGESFLRQGTPAELAVQGNHFQCANIALAALLCRCMKLAPYWRRSCYLDAVTPMVPEDRLRVLLQIFGKIHLKQLHRNCCFPRSPILNEFYTLMGSCILGESKIVHTLIQAPYRVYRWMSIRDELDKHLSSRNDVFYNVQQLAVCVEALSGDQECLQALLQPCVGRVAPQTLNRAYLCVLKLVWPWNLPQLLLCLKIIRASGVSFALESHHRLFPSLVSDSSEWMAQGPTLEGDLMKLQKTIPPSEEVSDLLDSVIKYGIDMIAINLRNVDIPKIIEATLLATTQLRQDSDIKSMERLLICLFYHRDTVPVLGCLGCHEMLLKLQHKQQVLLVKTVCQYMVMSQKWRMCMNGHCSCPMCHPVIKFLCGLDPRNLFPRTDDILGIICYYLSIEDLTWIQDALRNGIGPSTFCSLHKSCSQTKHYPMFFRLRNEGVPEVLRPILEIPRVPILFQASLMAVLKSLNGDVSRLELLNVPDGVRRHFFLHDFLYLMKE